jgi:hypothetical protein
MYCVNEDEAEKALVRELQRQVTEAIKVRDALPEGYRGEWADGELQALHEAGGSPFDALPANTHPDYAQAQKEVMRLAAARDAAERGYFRLNIFGMSIYRDAMIGLGVARTDYTAPTWPEFDKVDPRWIVEYVEKTKLPNKDTTLDRRKTRVMDPQEWFYAWEEEPKYRPDNYVEPSPEVVLAFKAHRARIEETLTWRPEPEDDFRIPLHKFGSNDGWHVSPEECFFAGNTLKTIREAEPERFYTVLGAAGIKKEGERAYFDRWIDYLLVASERGGFKVH